MKQFAQQSLNQQDMGFDDIKNVLREFVKRAEVSTKSFFFNSFW